VSSTNSPLECTGRELFYLSSLAGGGALIGIPDPFTGWLADDIADTMQQAQADLAQRHVVAIRPDRT
jgi:hypothetical protein